MGYGGVFNAIADPFGIGETDAPKPASPGKVAADYQQLLDAIIKSQPKILEAQNQYAPQYLESSLGMLGTALPRIQDMYAGANTAGRAADIADVTNLGPGAAAGVRGVYDTLNPESGALLGRLTRTANAGLDAGGKLMPEDVSRITRSTRSDWAARGLGASDPAMLSEAVNLATAGEGVRQSRQGFASSVYDRNGAVNTLLLNPSLALTNRESSAVPFAQAVAGSAGPTVIQPSQSYDLFNTAYNARSAANIAGANNEAAGNSY